MPPLATVRDHLVIEYSRFLLQDEARLHNAGDLEPSELKSWDTEPDVRPEWTVVVTGITRPDSPRVRLSSVTAAMTPHVLDLAKPGPHHLRAALRTTIDDENLDDYESDIIEERLLQLWPL